MLHVRVPVSGSHPWAGALGHWCLIFLLILKCKHFCLCLYPKMGFPSGPVVENLPANAGVTRDVSLIPGSGGSLGRRNGKPLQYSCLENPINRRAWWATVHGVAMSQTQLSDRAHILKLNLQLCFIKKSLGHPGSPVLKTSPSSARGAGSIPGQAAESPTCLLAWKATHKTEAIL